MILRLTSPDNFWYSDRMRLLFVADGRSPIAQNWIRYFADGGAEVTLASTFACQPELARERLEVVPVAFSEAAKPGEIAGGRPARLIRLRAAIRHWLGPLTIPRASRRLHSLIERVKPDLVHAMRIPYEGMLAADAYAGVPLVLSVWGNDFTLHATSNALMRHYTSWAMQVADALHTDCQRDLRLARQWGFDPSRPTLVAPGNGGVRLEVFHPPQQPPQQPIVVNPRGFRSYVRTDIFFQAIPQVLAKRADARFMCVAMQGEPLAMQWIRELGIEGCVELLPAVPHAEMADVFRKAQIVLSAGVHDGTPNTLLEGMSCGCLPIAGDLESIREWISPGRNGLLMDPNDPASVANAILEGLENESLRREAASVNGKLVSERAEYSRCMAAAERLYQRVISAHK